MKTTNRKSLPVVMSFQTTTVAIYMDRLEVMERGQVVATRALDKSQEETVRSFRRYGYR